MGIRPKCVKLTRTYAFTTTTNSDISIHLVPHKFFFALVESAYSRMMQCSVLSGVGVSLSSSGWYHCMQIRPSFGCVTELSSGGFAGIPSTLINWTGRTLPGKSTSKCVSTSQLKYRYNMFILVKYYLSFAFHAVVVHFYFFNFTLFLLVIITVCLAQSHSDCYPQISILCQCLVIYWDGLRICRPDPIKVSNVVAWWYSD